MSKFGVRITLFQVLLLLVVRDVMATCDDVYAKQSIDWIITAAPGSYQDPWSRAVARSYARINDAEVTTRNYPESLGRNKGIRRMKDAFPDGLTLGTTDATAMLDWLLSDLDYPPDWEREFEIVGNLYHHRLLWVAAPYTGIVTIDDLHTIAKVRPVVAMVDKDDEVGRLNISMMAQYLDLPIEFTGTNPLGTIEYRDPTGRIAAFMDEAGRTPDFAVGEMTEIWPEVESGNLLPILQISDSRTSFHGDLLGVHSLAGELGIAEMKFPGDEERESRANTIIAMSSLGMIMIAPPDLNEFHFGCIRSGLSKALYKRPVRRVAHKQEVELYAASAERTKEYLQAIVENGPWLVKLRN